MPNRKSNEKVECQCCGTRVQRRRDASSLDRCSNRLLLRVHGPRHRRCEGSGKTLEDARRQRLGNIAREVFEVGAK